MNRFLFLLLGAASLCAGVARADVPRVINFQGRLTTVAGTEINGQYLNITFSIYNVATGGTACFAEANSVYIANGLFNVNIGASTSGGVTGLNDGGVYTKCDFNSPYWLELNVNGDGAMTPRVALTASPYALRAEVANRINPGAQTVNGALTVTGVATVAGAVTASSDLTVNGKMWAQLPRWTVFTDETANNRTTPTTFTQSSQGSLVSNGDIELNYNTYAGYSRLYQMKVYAPSATTITQKLYYVDDNAYFYLNGALVTSVTGNGTKNVVITWNLVAGTNTLQVVVNNSGGSGFMLSLMGDYFYRYGELEHCPAGI